MLFVFIKFPNLIANNNSYRAWQPGLNEEISFSIHIKMYEMFIFSKTATHI